MSEGETETGGQPRRQYRNWVMDSRRWSNYRPRPGDVIVATYPKCGTTWMQRIVNLLIFQTDEPMPVSKISPWYEMRIGPSPEALNAVLEQQSHRRALKTHTPLDGLPWHDSVRYIHVARDGRDACLSYHNHVAGFTATALERLGQAGLEDPEISAPYPYIPSGPAQYFHLWLTSSVLKGAEDGYQSVSYFDMQRSYWLGRQRDNLLMVHYADLTRDLEAEMHRVARFLDISVSRTVWPRLVAAATFATMKAQGESLMPNVVSLFEGGAERFFHKGENGRWRGVFSEADLKLYEAKLCSLPAACRHWLEAGRLESGDPRLQ